MAWVFKPDGSKQCMGTSGQTTDDAKEELGKLVGPDKIQDFFKTSFFVISQCFVPTGICHVAKVDDDAVKLLLTGIAGPNGWALWPFDDEPVKPKAADQHPFAAQVAEPGVPFPLRAGPEVPFPLRTAVPELDPSTGDGITLDHGQVAALQSALQRMTSITTNPTTLRELIGYRIHIVRPKDPRNLILYYGRVCIYVDDEDRITDISFH